MIFEWPGSGRNRAISIPDHAGIQYDDLSPEKVGVIGTTYRFDDPTFF